MKHYDVDPERLKRVFDNTTATYKFYWMLALLDTLASGKTCRPITFREMVGRMVGMAWQPLVNGCFCFGKSDALLRRIEQLIFQTELKASDLQERVALYIIQHPDETCVRQVVDDLTRYVPYRFLHPWFEKKMTNAQSSKASMDFDTYRCPYGIVQKTLIVNPAWREYMLDHLEFLQGFAIYHLMTFLKKYNDNILLPTEQEVAAVASGESTNHSILSVAESPATQYGTHRQLNRINHKIDALQTTVDSMLQWQPSATFNFIAGDQNNVSGGIFIKRNNNQS